MAIAIIAAVMISASVVIALTLMTEGVGIQHAYAKCKKETGCGGGHKKVTERRLVA